MKKLLLIALYGLIVISCKKDKCEDQSAINYNQKGDCIYSNPIDTTQTTDSTLIKLFGEWNTINQNQTISANVNLYPMADTAIIIDTLIPVNPMWPEKINIQPDSIIFTENNTTSNASYVYINNSLMIYNYQNQYEIDTLNLNIDSINNYLLKVTAVLNPNEIDPNIFLDAVPSDYTTIAAIILNNSNRLDTIIDIQMKWDFHK